MSLTPAQKIAKGCTNKSRRADEAGARGLAQHMIQTGKLTGKRAWVYSCKHCRGWHVTSHSTGATRLTAHVTADDLYVEPIAGSPR